jgi:hypothetical protein
MVKKNKLCCGAVNAAVVPDVLIIYGIMLNNEEISTVEELLNKVLFVD